jgi:hypothetical protein
MSEKYRGLKRRRDRIQGHKERVNKERFSFEENQNKLVHFWLIEKDDVPTSRFVVEIKLLKPITFKEFKKQLLSMIGGLYE